MRSDRRRTTGRGLLGGFLATAGWGHLTFARKGFQAQVPDWVPLDKGRGSPSRTTTPPTTTTNSS